MINTPSPLDSTEPHDPPDPTDHFRAEAQRLSKLAKARRERIRDLERELDRLRETTSPPETAAANPSPNAPPASTSAIPTNASTASDRLALEPTTPAPGGKRPGPRDRDEPLRLRRNDLTDPRVMLVTPARDLVEALRRGWAD